MEYTRDLAFSNIGWHGADGVELVLSGAARCRVEAEDEERADAFREAMTAILPELFDVCAEAGIPYFSLAQDSAGATDLLVKAMAGVLPEGAPTLKSICFTALCPDDESVSRLIAAKRALAVRRLCPTCGRDVTDVPPTQTYCPGCGVRLAPAPEAPKTYTPLEEDILANFSQYERLEAVQYYRRATGADAATARDAVAKLYKRDLMSRGLLDVLISSDTTPSDRIEYFANGINKGIKKLKDIFGGGPQQ